VSVAGRGGFIVFHSLQTSVSESADAGWNKEQLSPLIFLVATVKGSKHTAGEKKTRKYRGSSRVREQSRY